MGKKKNGSFLVIVVVLATAIGSFFLMKFVFHIHAYPEDQNKMKVVKESILRVNDLAESIDDNDKINLQDSLVEVNKVDSILNEDKFELELDDNSYFQLLEKEYKQELLKKYSANKWRHDMTVRYYHHETDNDKVMVLKDYKYYLHERPVEERYHDYASNVIYYGDNIATSDLKLIAYLLLQNGIELKDIAKSKYHDSWKKNAVEIGTDTALLKAPNMTLGDIRSFSK